MKVLHILLVFLISSGFVSAQEAISVDFSKEDYSPGETIQAEIFLDNVQSDISSSEVILNSNETEYSFNPNFVKLGPNFHYLYFDLLNLDSGDYNLTFKNIIFIQEEITYQEDFSFSFNIQPTNDSIVSVNPAVLDARNLQFNNIFDININNNEDHDVQVFLEGSVDFVEVYQESIELSSGESKFFTVYVSELLREDLQTEYVYVDYGDRRYSIPVWSGDYSSSVGLEGDLFFEGESILTTLGYGEFLTGGYVKVKNSFNISLENVNVELDESLEGVVFLAEDSFDVEANGAYNINLNLNEDGESSPGVYEGYIYVKSGSFEDQIFLSVTILEEEIEVINETLNEDEIIIIDEGIDTGLPEEAKETKIEIGAVAWTIIFVILVLLILFFLYKKKKKRKTNLPFFER